MERIEVIAEYINTIPYKYQPSCCISYYPPLRPEFKQLYIADITLLIGWDGESVMDFNKGLYWETLKGSGKTAESAFLDAWSKVDGTLR